MLIASPNVSWISCLSYLMSLVLFSRMALKSRLVPVAVLMAAILSDLSRGFDEN